MLKEIPKCISPELLKLLSEMGCGDTLVITDANFPAAVCAKENHLIRADGVPAAQLLDAVLQLLPLDASVPNPVLLVEKTQADAQVDTPIWDTYREIVQAHEPRGDQAIGWLDRYVFYTMATRAYVVIATTEQQPYAGVLLQKGNVD